MKAVNQSIGRAVRHKDDWAAILLLDQRYRAQGVQGALSTWVREGLDVPASFASLIADLRDFTAQRGAV